LRGFIGVSPYIHIYNVLEQVHLLLFPLHTSPLSKSNWCMCVCICMCIYVSHFCYHYHYHHHFKSRFHKWSRMWDIWFFQLGLSLFFYYYSYVHTRLGSFLPSAPTPSLTTHSAPSLSTLPPQYPAETILPLFLSLL
jgi:hypothetical protein